MIGTKGMEGAPLSVPEPSQGQSWLRRMRRMLRPSAAEQIRRMQSLQQTHRLRTAARISRRLQRRYGIFVSPLTQFGPGLNLPHPTGIVIGEGVRIGENVTIYQNVTLGGARLGDWKAGRYPRIGAGTVIFAGAVIVGAVEIGRNCTIGANAVVLKDVPDGATAVGIPARVIPSVMRHELPAASGE